MKRKLFVFSILVLMGAMLEAQVLQLSIGAQTNSIIRTVDDDYVLIYTQPSINISYFILYQSSIHSAQAVLVPDKWEVHDVRIHNGTDAYFCGTVSGKGLIGTFNIASLFSGSGGISHLICEWSKLEYVLPVDLKRLALYDDGGFVNMAMTGTSIWHKMHMLPNTLVMSAYLDPSLNQWKCNCYPNKDRFVQFTDVACLEDVVVAVGTDPDGLGCYMKTFQKVQRFPIYPMGVHDLVELSYGDPVGDVLAVHKENNTAVLGQFNKVSSLGVGTTLYEVGLSSVTGLPTATTLDVWRSSPLSYTNYGPVWQMLELNWDDDHVWLLQKAEYATAVVSNIADWLLKVPLVTPSAMAWLWQPHQCHAQSMDITPYVHFPWLSGEKPMLRVYEPLWQFGGGNCYDFDKFDFNVGAASWSLLYIDEGDDVIEDLDISIVRNVFPVEVTFICE